MAQIHWLGAGLSSVPGIRRLADGDADLILWNRTLAKAEAALEGLESKARARELKWDPLRDAVQSGDVLVSMLPATMHLQVAEVCLEKQANFVSTSYVSPEMKQLDAHARQQGICLVNEVGLDPGIDHLYAHLLVDEYLQSPEFDTDNKLYFRSWCGGFPEVANDFRYLFSWSPLGVLKALKSPAQWIGNGQIQSTDKPWKSVRRYQARLPEREETFEAYPNRDSLPFREQYGFSANWNVQEFIRGTLRLDGWTDAWQEIFELVEQANGEAGQQRLAEKSEQLWTDYQYESGQRDRVVLTVDLKADRGGETIWHRGWSLDTTGNERGSAMARLVSLTASLAVDSVLAGKLPHGVSPAPNDIAQVNTWLAQLRSMGEQDMHISII